MSGLGARLRGLPRVREADLSWVPPSGLPARTLRVETLLVLLTGLGASAIWSVLSLLRALAAPEPLDAQVTTMNASRSSQPWLDLLHQLVGIALALVPVALALHLLGRELPRPSRLIGFEARRPGPDLLLGATLAAVIGIPGLGLYLAARAAGLNTTIQAAALDQRWWAVPILVLAAAQNAVLEEVVMVGYLFTRWTQARMSPAAVVVGSALIRGSYHLYQGFGGFVGNVVMGLLLGAVYLRTRRVMPLVVAHTLLDVVAFVGYDMLSERVGWL